MATDHEYERWEYDPSSFAVLLLPGWRHPRTGKVHIRRDCRAVQFHAHLMQPILVRLDAENEVDRVLGGDQEQLCRWCFPWL